MERLPDGTTEWKRSPGGLVTALEPLLRSRKGAWIGWPGIPDSDEEPIVEEDLRLYPVRLSADDVSMYYEGFSNATLWPLYHDVIVKPIYHREWWDRYVEVNRRFAEATSRAAAHGRDGVGSGLSAAAGAEDAADAAARSHHRILSAHSVPTGGAVHADAVADGDHRRRARRGSRRLPSAGRRAELSVSWLDGWWAPTRRARRSVCVPVSARSRSVSAPSRWAHFRSPSTRGNSTPRPGTAESDSVPARSAASWVTHARSCSASIGSTTPRASMFG